ncbi:MAG: hypothetical protein Q7S51_03680, partial [Gallionellaceae bacterium]|nr:hypothetical protein [Gallionellaceae bacterium]
MKPLNTRILHFIYGLIALTCTAHATAATLSSVSVTPANPTLTAAGQTQQFTATGTFSDGSSQVLEAGSIKAISAGQYHTCAALTDDTVKCWGNNYAGQLGDGSTTDSTTPVIVSSLNNVLAVSNGGVHTCAALSDGTVKCWGYN